MSKKGKNEFHSEDWYETRKREFEEKVDFFQMIGLREIDLREYFKIIFERYGQSFLQERQFVSKDKLTPDNKCCGIIKFFDKKPTWKKEHARSFILTSGFEDVEKLMGHETCYCSPLCYIGRNRCGKNARAIFGFTLDIDYVDVHGLEFFYRAIAEHRAPEPSIITSSGSGIHLYFLLDQPLALNSFSGPRLHYLKNNMTKRYWGMLSKKDEPQYQGIYQGYRIPGTLPKSEYALPDTVKAFVQIDPDEIPYYTISDLNYYVGINLAPDDNPPLDKATVSILETMIYDPDAKKIPLEEAKELWPEWAEKRKKKIDMHLEMMKIKQRSGASTAANCGTYVVNRALYDWWLRSLRSAFKNKVKVGHRYHCIAALAVYASKCNIPFAELKKDADSLYQFMESLSTNPANHFHKKDIKDALDIYGSAAKRITRANIELKTGIRIGGKPRKGYTREQALEIARSAQKFKCQNSKTDWREGNGRKSKAEAVFWWRQANPLYIDGVYQKENANKARCARECQYEGYQMTSVEMVDENGEIQIKRVKTPALHQLSRTSVTKWWNSFPENTDDVGIHEMVVWAENNEELNAQQRLDFYNSDFFRQHLFNGDDKAITLHDCKELGMNMHIITEEEAQTPLYKQVVADMMKRPRQKPKVSVGGQVFGGWEWQVKDKE